MNTNDIEIENLTIEEKRETRRQRRRKDQRKAYIGLGLMVVVIVALVVGSIMFIQKQVELKKQQEAEMVITKGEITESTEEDIDGTEEIMPEDTVEEPAEQPEYSSEMVLDEVVEAVISEMTLEEKVAGLFVVTPESITGV